NVVGVELRPSLAAVSVNRVAGVALLDLYYVRSLPLEGCVLLQIVRGYRLAAPCIHRGTPRRMTRQAREAPERDRQQQDGQHRDRAPPPALLALTGDERKRQQDDQHDRRSDQQRGRLERRRQQREHGIEPQEEEIGTWRGLDDR